MIHNYHLFCSRIYYIVENPKNIRQTSCGCTNQNRNDQGLVYFKTVTKRVRNKF